MERISSVTNKFTNLGVSPNVLKELIFSLWWRRKRFIKPLHQVNLGKCIDS